MKQNPSGKFLEKPRHALDLRFQKSVHQKVNALLNGKIMDPNGNVIGEIHYADGNTIFQMKSAGGANSISAFAITELSGGDFYTARKLSNVRLVGDVPTADVGATDFKIAKPIFVRKSITSELLYGSTITYRDDPDGEDADNTRIANDGENDERQVIIAPYITLTDLGLAATAPMNAQCVVYAKQVPGLTGVFDADGAQLEWMEETQGARVFAKRNLE